MLRRLLLSALLLAPVALLAQNQPFIVHDTKPVITHGPYLVDPSETAMTVVWTTDTPSHALVRYGESDTLGSEAEAPVYGLLPVGTLHRIRLTGLQPGRTYDYQVVATRVVRLKAYWPEKGLSVESPIASFTTLDRSAVSVSFSAITDTHEDVARINALMKLIDWKATDFFVHMGDAFDWVESETQLFDKWLDPVARGLAQQTPLVFVRGNHELRGPFARQVFDYVPTASGQFYGAFDHGPLHLIVLDSGEDKDDDTNVYARLNRVESYRREEYAWLERHADTDPRMKDAPFCVVLVHQPDWGWVDGENARWTALANRAGVDLVIAGHRHRYQHAAPGELGTTYPILVLDQDQIARVEASATAITVTVRGKDGAVADTFTVSRRSLR